MVVGLARLGVVVALVGACSQRPVPSVVLSREQSPSRVTVAVPVRVAPATVAASWADIVPLPPLLAPELADIYSGYARESDPRQWFFSQPQQPPLGFVGLRRQSGTFPGGKYAKIRAYRYGGDGSYPSPSRLDPYTPGCGSGMVASDGTLCPSVQYPGWDVTAERA